MKEASNPNAAAASENIRDSGSAIKGDLHAIASDVKQAASTGVAVAKDKASELQQVRTTRV